MQAPLSQEVQHYGLKPQLVTLKAEKNEQEGREILFQVAESSLTLPWWRWPQRVTFLMSSELSIRSAKKLKGERKREEGLWQTLPNGKWRKGVSRILSGTTFRPTGECSEADVNFYVYMGLALEME